MVEGSRARWSARGAGDMDVTRADADGRFSSLSSTTSPAPAAVRASLFSDGGVADGKFPSTACPQFQNRLRKVSRCST